MAEYTANLCSNAIGQHIFDRLGRPARFRSVPPEFLRVVAGALDQVENDVKYEGYINKHERLLNSRAHLDNLEMPNDLDYKNMTALSYEAREKLDRIRPATLGEAGRIDGVRAGDLAVLTVILKKSREAKP